MVRRLEIAALLGLAGALTACTELCVPGEANLAFFSKGDCVLTKASFFQGHEWITYFGNEDLEASQRFPSSELLQIAEGNRRVDWPLELLVRLNASPVAYVQAIAEYTDRPENQKLHFLLSDVNTTREAVADSVAEIRRLSVEGVGRWAHERSRALALFGRATHIIQDSFSKAHSIRDGEREDCIEDVKAYIERAEGADDTGVTFHGGREVDTIGHTTTEDSIYREGRDCHEPAGREEVETCLNGSAQRARLATRDYLGMVHRAVARSVGELEGSAEEILSPDFDAYVTSHFRLCEDTET
ncbi:MAG TPA: hypothetical protein VGK73_05265 [Polyangiaceae bacterium]